MNREEFRRVIVRMYAVEPAYKAWVEEQVASIAPTINCSEDAAYEGMVAEWLRAIGPYTPEEINAAIDQIASTHRQFPAYGKLWRTLAGYAADNKAAARETERASREHEPRFHCLTCMDSGSVTVYNPAFLRWLRPEFEQRRQTGLNWYYRARSEWNRKVLLAKSDGQTGQAVAPAEVGLVCQCDCDNARVYRNQVSAMVASLNARSEKPKRAAYIGQWTEGRQCLVIDHADELVEWFAEHDDSQDFEWHPSAGEYESRFNRG